MPAEVSLEEHMARQIASDLGVSVEAVVSARRLGITVNQLLGAAHFVESLGAEPRAALLSTARRTR